ncbi:MAG: 3-isopropylmalate dehydratase large subunit [Chloroflexota bacterium]
MGATFTEKILARKAGVDSAKAGDILDVEPDVVLSHDNTAAIAKTFRQLPHGKIKHPERVAISLDHTAPAPTPRHAELHDQIRKFVAEQGIINFYEVGRGICHQVISEEALISPGKMLVGADSHSPHYGWMGAFGAGIGRTEVAAVWATGQLWMRVPETLRVTLIGELRRGVMSKDFTLSLIGQLSSEGANYMAVQFDGDGAHNLSIDSRMVITNMMAEMGAKNAYMAPDDDTFAWLEKQLRRSGRSADDAAIADQIAQFREEALYSDEDAEYAAHHTIDLSAIEPAVARPHHVDNVVPLSDVAGLGVDVGFIGTCTNGRLEDLAAAAEVVRGKKLSKRLIIVPASSQVMEDASRNGVLGDLLAAGATLGTPGCGPCVGNHMGVLAPGEVCISSANRNFQGRMGQREAEIYLSNPAVVAASALVGKITHPDEI